MCVHVHVVLMVTKNKSRILHLPLTFAKKNEKKKITSVIYVEIKIIHCVCVRKVYNNGVRSVYV